MSSKFKKFGNAVLILGLMAGSFGVGAGVAPLKVAAQTRSFSTLVQVIDLLHSEFIDSKLDDTKLEYGAIRGMLSSLDDPYTRFMEPTAFKNMQEERSGSFSGIGIQIGMKDKHLTVIAPLEDTPAWKAGLKTDDQIVAINGKPTKDMAIEEAVTLIRGPKGTGVKMMILRGNARPFPVTILRDDIVTKAVKTKELPNDIGYIRLSTFMNENADTEMKDALTRFKGKKGIILDLRGNPGGLLPNAVNIGSMFIKSGPIVQIVDRSGEKEQLPATGNLVLSPATPVVVLVDGGSASASEILSGALQDTHRATLVGTKTFGKGLVQTVHALEGGAGVAITSNKYLTAGGHDINHHGIMPNVVVELPKLTMHKGKDGLETINPEDLRTFKDTQLEKAEQLIKEEVAHNTR